MAEMTLKHSNLFGRNSEMYSAEMIKSTLKYTTMFGEPRNVPHNGWNDI